MRPRTLAVGALVMGLVAAGSPAMAESNPSPVLIRVDQVGYATTESKHAYLMTSAPSPGAGFTVVDHRGREVLRGKAGADLGSWNSAYGHVYTLDLSRLRRTGTYHIKSGTAVSPGFRIARHRAFADTASKAVTFFGGQRDGAGVLPGPLRRKPSHLNDRAADVYDWPTFTGPGTDQIKGELTKVGGPVDVEGGWYDAGDYLKFTHILSYVDTLMWATQRDAGRAADPRLAAEAAHGLRWLDKMWDEKTKTLYIQVGIGAGNEEGTFVGDHDIWRLPEADDGDTGADRKFIRNRPVFRAAAPGRPISPNLAGRTAAAFALASQVEPDRRRAAGLLDKAAQIYAMAKTENVGTLVTSLPHAFYPETLWRDDMELGGAELALAAARLRDPRAADWLRQAAHWASEYITHDRGDTLNLYDVSALAHADLVKAIRATRATGLAVGEADLLGDIKAQLDIGAARAAADPFRAGARYDQFDSVPRTFGLIATAKLYRAVSGDRTYDDFGTRQRNWALGANAWGTSFMVGAGEGAIACPHHQIANLTRRPAVGAVVNGPNSKTLFDSGLGGHFAEMNHCPPDGVDRFDRFTGRGSRFVDDVRSWQASEPADDFAAIALYALSLTAKG
ncbi:N-terminal ig-like domain of cellulase [Sinosporangium album]|uniref:N-terminal ig-like domain of cellulase n=1 Tax=Sinosporangium album TaxID=504805 RepID=A0A1G7XDH0_9ACTN|nr:glycoside hydrolase family 9 protein [Sinosporangium album]SDG82335.1 N-terminal ig-like domain of cellulase [Sinosporangium album]